ncbi:hypothetical protein [Gorillibacterium sp. CAU 1737]|uniref:HAAS signaling domain-containing protein n=1 Tax=Gorillibacterium sp. CAU 1737 TaxID=3140362 RepID=UPI003260569F
MTSFRIEEFVAKVLARLQVDAATKKRIERDLTASILERAEREGVEAALQRMGTPEEVAREFSENLGGKVEEDRLPDQLAQLIKNFGGYPYYEYKSKRTLFGLPLVHIKLRRTSFIPPGGLAVAKGILAVGDIAFGFASMGILSFGLLSLGVLSIGLLAFGAIALGLGMAGGAIAVGTFAAGAIAVGVVSFGALAIGHMAVGAEVVGEITRKVTNAEPLRQGEIRELLRAAFPNWFK